MIQVQISGTVKEEDFGIADQLKVEIIIPAERKEEFGRVTRILDEFIVFEAKAVLVKSALPDFTEALEQHQECQYEMIESEQKIGDQIFKWRVTKVITVVKPLLPKPQQINIIEKNIKMVDLDLKISLNPSVISKSRYVFIQNNSSEDVKLIKCCIDPPLPDIVKLDKEYNSYGKVLYHLNSRDKNGFRRYLHITPTVEGIYVTKLIADFETSRNEKIQKKCKITIEVHNETNLQSGPRYQKPPRFVDIRIKDFLVPNEIRKIDFTKTKDVVDELKKTFPFFNEPQITPSNYCQKFHYAIYLDEIAMEISFKSYHIPKARFEDVKKDGSGEVEFLKLDVKDVAERRPSIIMGDAIEGDCLLFLLKSFY